MSEASLMKKSVLADIHAQNVDLAIQADRARKRDLRGGAALAGVSYHEFLHEVQSRKVVVLEDDQSLEELEFLATAFDDATRREAVQKVCAADELLTPIR